MNKSTSFLYKIITFVVILSIVPVLIVGIFSFIRSSKIIDEHVANEKQHSVFQIQTNVEQLLKTIDHSVTQFSTSPHIKHALKDPLRSEQFQLYNQLRQEMGHQQTFDTKVGDFVLMSFTQNWLLNNHGLQRLDEETASQMIDTYADSQIASTWILEKKQKDLYKSLPSPNCDYQVTLVQHIPFTSSTKTGLTLTNIPTCSLLDLQTVNNENESFIILDDQGQIISHTDQSLIGEKYKNQDVLQFLTENDQELGQINSTLDGVEYKITYRTSSYNNWTYLSLVKLTDINKQSRSIGWFTFFICTFIALSSLIIGYLGSKRIYRPVQRIQEIVLRSLKTDSEITSKNEFELIESQFHNMLKQNDALEETLQSQVSQLKQFFISRLLDGRIHEDELPGKFNYFGYNFDYSRLSLLAIQIDSLEESGYKNKEEDVILLVINNMVEKLIPSTHRLTPIVKNNVQVTILTSNHETDEQHIYYLNNIAESIQQKVKEELNITVSIGVSNPFTTLTLSKTAYKEALEALKYTLKYGIDSVIFFESLERSQSFHTFFPKQIENEMFDAIKISDKEQVDRILEQFVAEVFTKDLNHHQYQIIFIRFLNDLIELMQTLGINVLEVEDNKTIFEEIYNLKSKRDVKEWFTNMIIYPLIQTIEQRSESQYKNISDKMIHIIQEEFDTDLTLETIAARLHYNPNYLSSIFRKEMNISFSEYLSMYRINKAKEWLVETKMSVKEISERLNYNNSQNFIRSFKKFEGTTPGKYRDERKNL